MKRKEYESPQTKKTMVSLESGICAASINVKNPEDEQNGQIEGHQVNESFKFEYQESDWTIE